MAKHVYIIVAGLALALAMVFVVLAIGAYVLQPIPGAVMNVTWARQKKGIKMVGRSLSIVAILLALTGATHAEGATKDNLIYSASAVGLYKTRCDGEVPAGAWEAADIVVRTYGRQAVVEKMVELTAEVERIGIERFCRWVEETIFKRNR
jgi:hypothetical protein